MGDKDVAHKDTIQKTVEYTKGYVEASVKLLESTGAAIIRKYLYELDSYVQPAKDAIADAKKKGVDITACQKKEQALERLVDEVTKSVNSCISKQVGDTKNEIVNIYKCSEQGIRDLCSDMAKMYYCEDVTCIAKAGIRATFRSTKSAIIATARTGTLNYSIPKRIYQLPVKCGSDVVGKFTEDLKQAAQDVQDCVAKESCKDSSKFQYFF